MPRYFFVLQWLSHKHDDNEGTVLPNDKAARAYGDRVIRELKQAGGYDDPTLRMIVQKAARETLFSIRF